MKTPEEIKKGLEIEISVHYHLPNPEPRLTPREFMYMEQLHSDALAYIQQLESRLAQVERERDAAVFDLGVEKSCYTCEHGDIYKSNGCYGDCNKCEKISCPCESCRYKWRGVCEENTKEE